MINQSQKKSKEPVSLIIYLSSQIIHFTATTLFELKGSNGDERVKIFNVKTKELLTQVQLSRDWQNFSYPSFERVKIKFYGEKVANRAVIFREATNFKIMHLGLWEQWSCNLQSESKNCSLVRDGLFNWQGYYLVELKK